MPKFIKTGQPKHQSDELSNRLKYYPLRIFTYLILAGISSAFLMLSASYALTTYGTKFNNFPMPLLFHANSIIMLVSSYAMAQTRKAAKNDDHKAYLTGLIVTSALGVAFMSFQVVGWQELLQHGIHFTNNIAGTYIYLISGLHMVHLVAGVIALVAFSIGAVGNITDPVKALLFETNPFAKLKVDLLATYWHFVDALWIYLYVFFLLNIYVLNRQ